MLVLIVGSSYMLVSRLNEYAQAYARDTQTRLALLQAKQALLNYAMNYPELNDKPDRGPGYLPCPDENDDGATESNCSVTTGSTLGRLPTETLGLGDLRDSSGERLWYAVSQNFKYNQSSDYVLNSDTRGTISVDGTDDIVAVIIAPGAPVSDQNSRHGATETAAIASNDIYQVADQYLEGDNATTADASYATSGTGEFNDQVVTITRSELMQYVQRRVVEQVRKSLAAYHATTGAYPWLAPFSDPRADARWLKGDASSASAASLVDSSADFVSWGVTIGDIVWNITEGTVATVSGTPTSTTVPTSGLSFSSGDEYLVEPSASTTTMPSALSGSAGAGSTSTVLEDTSKNFEALLVEPGDIVDDLTDGSTGQVESVSGDTITVTGLSHGTNNTFAAGDSYRVRSNSGTATSGSTGTTLEDSTVNFQSSGARPMGVQPGDLVTDFTDGSFGVVSAVTGTHMLTVSTLNKQGSVSSSFSSGDLYAISRYHGASGANEGLLSLQEPGQGLPTAFTLDWSASAVNVSGGTSSTYNNAITALASASANHNATVSVATSDGECTWVEKTIADCSGIDSDVLSGTATSWSGGVLFDPNKQFAAQGIKRGDKISNLATGTQGIVTGAASGQVSVRSISGYTAFSISAGQAYRVYPAQNSVSGTALSVNLFGFYIITSSAALTGVSAGDVIVDTTSGNATGLITAVASPFFTVTNLSGGSSSLISLNDSFTIYSSFVQRRDLVFRVRMKGDEVDAVSSQVRTRTVCSGYDSTCTTAGSAAFPDNGIAPQVSVLDYNSTTSGSVIGSATAPASSASGSMRISGISYPLAADDTDNGLPSWFVDNRWHQLVYVAYGSAYGPGGAGSCTAGTDCLTLTVQMPATSYNDKQALVMSAGMPLGTQDRTLGQIDSYYEAENAVEGDDVFEKGEITTSFNDQIAIIAP